MADKELMTNRRLTAVAFSGLALGTLAIVRPSRTQVKRGTVTALAVAAGDFLFERLMRTLGLWSYDLPGSVSGMPLDLFIDFFLWVWAYCTGLAYFERRGSRRATTAYIAAITVVLGTWAWYKNKVAAEAGIIEFSERVGPDTWLFAAGSYALIDALLAIITAAYRYTSRLFPQEGRPVG